MARSAASRSRRFNWKAPSCAALAVAAVYISLALFGLDDFFISMLFVAPALLVTSIGLILYAITPWSRGRRLTLLCTLVILWLAASGMFLFDARYDLTIRTDARWLVWSRGYKTQVLTQSPSTDGDFKHMEWDGWGFAPAGETTVYLVYDPLDSLFSVAKKHQSGRFEGIPCAVFNVKRLERHWYTVIFYSDETWEHCN